MDNRAKDVERGVAREFNKWFEQWGLDKIERIPAPGREGPDVTYNSLRLIIDPKSRKSNPKSHKLTERGLFLHKEKYVSTRLKDLDLLAWEKLYVFTEKEYSKTVYGFWEHLDSWRRVYVPAGITLIILHWPRMDYDASTVIMAHDDLSRFRTAFRRYVK